jgi:hypothetical protein
VTGCTAGRLVTRATVVAVVVVVGTVLVLVLEDAAVVGEVPGVVVAGAAALEAGEHPARAAATSRPGHR